MVTLFRTPFLPGKAIVFLVYTATLTLQSTRVWERVAASFSFYRAPESAVTAMRRRAPTSLFGTAVASLLRTPSFPTAAIELSVSTVLLTAGFSFYRAPESAVTAVCRRATKSLFGTAVASLLRTPKFPTAAIERSGCTALLTLRTTRFRERIAAGFGFYRAPESPVTAVCRRAATALFGTAVTSLLRTPKFPTPAIELGVCIALQTFRTARVWESEAARFCFYRSPVRAVTTVCRRAPEPFRGTTVAMLCRTPSLPA